MKPTIREYDSLAPTPVLCNRHVCLWYVGMVCHTISSAFQDLTTTLKQLQEYDAEIGAVAAHGKLMQTPRCYESRVGAKASQPSADRDLKAPLRVHMTAQCNYKCRTTTGPLEP
jgi:hypothetical protein